VQDAAEEDDQQVVVRVVWEGEWERGKRASERASDRASDRSGGVGRWKREVGMGKRAWGGGRGRDN
jgi:hypothetical protein